MEEIIKDFNKFKERLKCGKCQIAYDFNCPCQILKRDIEDWLKEKLTEFEQKTKEEPLDILPETIMMSKAKGVYGASYIAKQMTTIEEAKKTSGYGKTLKEALADLAIKLKQEGII